VINAAFYLNAAEHLHVEELMCRPMLNDGLLKPLLKRILRTGKMKDN